MSAREHLAALVRWAMRDVTYHRLYAATVTVTNLGWTVDLEPDDPDMRGLGLQRVPIRTGLPATEVSALAGARCLFGFDGGNPQKPSVRAWEYKQNSGTTMLDGGGAGLARVAELVDVLLESSTPITGILLSGTMTLTNPPFTVSPMTPGPIFTGAATITGPIRGQPMAGAPKVRA